MELYFKEVGWVLGKRIEDSLRQEGVKKTQICTKIYPFSVHKCSNKNITTTLQKNAHIQIVKKSRKRRGHFTKSKIKYYTFLKV